MAAVVAAIAVALCLPDSARAGSNASGACDEQAVQQPFLPWADPAHYVLAPNGTSETAAGWNLDGAAARVRGNESFYVNSRLDSSSIALPQGSSATTGSMCVGVEHPTLRFFARNRGSLLSSLQVEVLYRDAWGTRRAATIGGVLGGEAWQPTAPLPVTVNLFDLVSDEQVEVAFRFTPQGAGDWSIDDVYVDPFRHG
jgi:hypothetical protein